MESIDGVCGAVQIPSPRPALTSVLAAALVVIVVTGCAQQAAAPPDGGRLDAQVVVDLAVADSNADRGSADRGADLDQGPGADAAGPALCPGGKPFTDGDLSGIYHGTAVVKAGAFNKGGTHKATLGLASVCGSIRGLLTIEQSTDPLAGAPSYKLKSNPAAGGKLALVLSDRYCGATTCYPHLTAGAGLEIFDVEVMVGGGSITSVQVAVRKGVSYAGLELPFESLAVSRTFPSTGHTPTATPVAGVWVARLLTTTEFFAMQPVSGDNELTLTSVQVSSWKIPWMEDALADKLLFPAALLNPTHRRVGVTQTGTGGTYDYAAVLDGNWLIGVVRDGSSGGVTTPDVPTAIKTDDALYGVWIGQHKPD